MVKYVIVDEEKGSYFHTITRIGLFKKEAFIQELTYGLGSKSFRQTTITLSVKAAKKMMGVL